LGISSMTTKLGRALCTSIQNMVYLTNLIVVSISEVEIIGLTIDFITTSISRACLSKGAIGEVVQLDSRASESNHSTIIFLIIWGRSTVICSGFALITLSLNHAYDGLQLHFNGGGFRKLKNLTLRGLERLNMVEIDRGSLPVLEKLEFGPCPRMKEVFYGIEHLKSLKILDFYEMQGEFVLAIQPDGGKDYWKVKKVTTIRFKYRIKGERYQIYKLGDSDLLERLQRWVLEVQTALQFQWWTRYVI
jgi:disease resistance protein RPM1